MKKRIYTFLTDYVLTRINNETKIKWLNNEKIENAKDHPNHLLVFVKTSNHQSYFYVTDETNINQAICNDDFMKSLKY